MGVLFLIWFVEILVFDSEELFLIVVFCTFDDFFGNANCVWLCERDILDFDFFTQSGHLQVGGPLFFGSNTCN